jgi:hypothetical protein
MNQVVEKVFFIYLIIWLIKKAPHLTGGLLKQSFNYLSETTLIGTFATT